MWKEVVIESPPLKDLNKLPDFSFVFFFKNMGDFKWPFICLTAGSMLGTLLKFFSVYLLSDLISNLDNLTTAQVFKVYLPFYLFTVLSHEILDYFTRKHAEALPTVFTEHLALRFYKTILGLSFHRLFNLSKEQLAQLIGRYSQHIKNALSDWVWGTTANFTSLIIVLAVLWVQSPKLMLLNLAYITGFLFFSFRMSSSYSILAQKYSSQDFETCTTIQRFTLNLNSVKRLGIRTFFLNTYRALLEKNWLYLENVQHFHARRWFVQLNLFRVLYVSTLFYGAYQIKIGELPLGYLVLLAYAFDSLAGILMYAVEYYVSLIQQREDARIIRAEFSKVFSEDSYREQSRSLGYWRSIELRNVSTSLGHNDGQGVTNTLSIPQLYLKRGAHVGIIGPSGSGKTTILNLLLRVIEFQGEYLVDGKKIEAGDICPDEITIINNSDPLFIMTLKENILLGRDVDDNRLNKVLAGVEADDFGVSLDAKIGDSTFNLSSGQEQRIRLARGLLNTNGLVLLDEAFNGIDSACKASIISFLRDYLTDATIVLVTHNHDELALVDQVYELRDGVLQKSNQLPNIGSRPLSENRQI